MHFHSCLVCFSSRALKLRLALSSVLAEQIKCQTYHIIMAYSIMSSIVQTVLEPSYTLIPFSFGCRMHVPLPTHFCSELKGRY
jgi:hypothetical protein